MRTEEKIKILRVLRNLLLIFLFVYLVVWVLISITPKPLQMLFFIIGFIHFTMVFYFINRIDKQIRILEINR